MTGMDPQHQSSQAPLTRPNESIRTYPPLPAPSKVVSDSNGRYPLPSPPSLPSSPWKVSRSNGSPNPSQTPHRKSTHPPPLPSRKPESLRRNVPDQARQIQDSGEDITFTKNDIIIAIMGVTGAGKSTFISLLSDQEIEIGHGLQSCTTKVGVYYFRYQGVRIFLVDTPGFDDTNRSDAEVLKDVAFWLAAAYSKEAHLAGIIYLHRISDPKMGGSALRNLRMFTKLCGSNNLNSVVLATTHWTNAETGATISESTGQARINELIETESFWGGMIHRGSRVERHDGSRQSAMAIVSKIVDRKIRVILDIQRQLIDQRRNLDDTDAAQALQSELIAERKKFEARLSELKEDMDFAIQEKDQKWQQQIKEEQAKHQADIAKTYAETEALRTNLHKIAKEKDEQFRALQEEMATQHRKYTDQIKQTTDALKGAQEEQRRRADEHEQQRKEDAARAAQMAEKHQRNIIEIQARMREEHDKAVLAQMERQREDQERWYQQQREEARAAAEAEEQRWARQQRIEKEREQRLIEEKNEAYRRIREIELEQKKSKVFFLDAVKTVFKVVSFGAALMGYAPYMGF